MALAAISRIIKQAGAERASGSAFKEMMRVIEELDGKIGREALIIALCDGRKTDIGKGFKIAAKKVMNQRYMAGGN